MTARPYRHAKRQGRTVDVHVLVWTDAHGPVPPGHVVHHKNHNKRDNRLENLQLMTNAEHSAHHNNRHPRVKVCAVCSGEYEPAPTKRARSKTCGVQCLRRLQSLNQSTANSNLKIDAETRATIRKRIAAGERRSDLASEYGVSRASMTRYGAGL